MPSSLRSSSSASSVSSSGLYVPLHKRRSSSVTRTESSSTDGSSSRPSSRAESHIEFDFSELADAHPGVYSRDRLLALAKSPLAVMSKEVKDGLRERLPEIVMSRKHRKAKEYRALMQQRAQEQPLVQRPQPQPQVQPSSAQLYPPSQTHQQRQQHNSNSHQRHHVPQQAQVPPQTPASWHPHSRPIGRAWWSTTKPAVDDINWRKIATPASISVA